MNNLRSFVLLAAVAAFVLLPFSFEFTGAMLFVAALAGFLILDYTRPSRIRRLAVAPSPQDAFARGSSAALRLAA